MIMNHQSPPWRGRGGGAEAPLPYKYKYYTYYRIILKEAKTTKLQKSTMGGVATLYSHCTEIYNVHDLYLMYN